MTPDEPKLHFSLPPITEAILAFNFSAPLEKRWLEKVPTKLKKEYELKAPLKNYSVSIEQSPTGEDKSSIKIEELGLRLASKDQTNILQISQNFITFHRLAPYIDWEYLRTSAQNGLETLDKLAGVTPINKLSTRYLNRIDIPFEDLEKRSITFERYFALYSTLPPAFESMANVYNAWSRAFDDVQQGYRYVINFSPAPPAILDHHSFSLDIEVTSIGEIPSKRSDLWAFVEKFRSEKNKAFLSCLTQETIGLFK
ncbi:MAG: TIGR04255 family protein [Alphaproteobacteria bacterium]|nr:TIGR04255 family protein [Alphaproteobacteria bacterium]